MAEGVELEIATAQAAFEMNPAWTRAAFSLADALERGNELEQARHIYERALQHTPEDARLHAHLAHVFWRRRQKAAAFAAIEKALQLSPGYEWAWNWLRNWVQEVGEPRRTAEIARNLTRERPGEFFVWLTLARMLEGPSTMAERLRAVEQALKLDRQSTDAWDLKAQLLAIDEHFNEAIKTCQEGAAVCLVDVHTLRGRQAWVEAKRNNVAEAVRLMRAVLADNANYVWGWSQMAEWLIRQNATDEAAAALEQLSRLHPHDPWVNRQLGLLRLKQNDKVAAQKSFAAVLRQTPADVQAAHQLVHLQLKSS